MIYRSLLLIIDQAVGVDHPQEEEERGELRISSLPNKNMFLIYSLSSDHGAETGDLVAETEKGGLVAETGAENDDQEVERGDRGVEIEDDRGVEIGGDQEVETGDVQEVETEIGLYSGASETSSKCPFDVLISG